LIRIATAHHHSVEWIQIQRSYLDRFIDEPFTLYGSLENVPEAHHAGFDVVVSCIGNHSGKLNFMGHAMLADAEPDDLLVFLDGDAFPVGDVMGRVRILLADADLVAVQRLENTGDCQPHPCFCVVPARTWASLPGDWSSGYPFRSGRTDVGGNLLWLLEDRGLTWASMLRTNRVNPHPLLFGVYDDVLYHHGAGFRGMKPPGQGRPEWQPKQPQTAMSKHRMDKYAANLPKGQFDAIIARAMEDAVLSDDVYAQILADPDFFQRFI
jgi:hypothetical protein